MSVYFCFKWHNFIFLLAFLCVPVCVWVHTHTHKRVHVVARGWHCVFHSPLHLPLFWERAYHSVRTHRLARMSGQWSPGIPLSPVCAYPCPLFVPAAALRLQRHSALCGASRLNSGPYAPTDTTYPLSHIPAQLLPSFFLMTAQNSMPLSITVFRNHTLFSCHSADRHLGWFHILLIGWQ